MPVQSDLIEDNNSEVYRPSAKSNPISLAPSTANYEPYEEDFEEDLEFERTSTMIDEIICNDGNLFLEISGNTMLKKKGKEFV